MKTVKVAMIKTGSHFADQEAGSREAAMLVKQAASQDADIAVLPELTGCGYIPNQSVWDLLSPKMARQRPATKPLSAFNCLILCELYSSK